MPTKQLLFVKQYKTWYVYDNEEWFIAHVSYDDNDRPLLQMKSELYPVSLFKLIIKGVESLPNDALGKKGFYLTSVEGSEEVEMTPYQD